MRDRAILILIGLFVLGTGALIASDRHSVALVEKAATEAVKECSSCTLRHQSFARAKKAREKNQLKLGDQFKSSATQPAQQ